jgi:hypothetical protein
MRSTALLRQARGSQLLVRPAPLIAGRLRQREIFSPFTGGVRSRVGYLPPNTVDESLLSAELRPAWLRLDMREAVADFLLENPGFGEARRTLNSLSKMVPYRSGFALQETHILDRPALLALLPGPDAGAGGGAQWESLLDVGAGPGSDARRVSSLFGSVLATEAAEECIRSMKVGRGLSLLEYPPFPTLRTELITAGLLLLAQRKGIPCVLAPCLQTSPGAAQLQPSYDVITCHNVLDRCERPVQVRRRMCRPNGLRRLRRQAAPTARSAYSAPRRLPLPAAPEHCALHNRQCHLQRPTSASRVVRSSRFAS